MQRDNPANFTDYKATNETLLTKLKAAIDGGGVPEHLKDSIAELCALQQQHVELLQSFGKTK